jgi:hypothetical protein
VLFSSFPLEQSLAVTLHQAALALYQSDAGVGPVAGDMVSGRVVNLKKSLSFGSIVGPAFEAEIDTARGSGKVRYLLTREGLEAMGVSAPAPRRSRRELMN